jgi:PAP2 superfamily
VEANVQRAVQTLPGLTSLLGVAYLTFHLAVTAGVLLWLHRRRPDGFPLVRTSLLLASGLAIVGFLVYPTAPPRLAGVGISDTVSGRHVDLNRGLVSSLYNPYAAVPSMHVGYALNRRRWPAPPRSTPARPRDRSALPDVRVARHRRPRQPLLPRRCRGRARRGARCRARPPDTEISEGSRINDRRPYSLLQIRELGHGIHDLPGFDTSDFRSFAVRLDPHETRLPIARSAETLLLVVEGSLTVVWCDASHASTEFGERDAAMTNPPSVEALRAGTEGATFLATVGRI